MRARAGRVNVPVLVLGLAVIVGLVWLLASGFGKDPRALPDAMSGRPAPAFTATTMDGEVVSLADLKGRTVVLNFWATWCGPCVAEHPDLKRIAGTFAPRGVVFLGILYNDEPDEARRWLKRHGEPYPTMVDPNGRMAIDYGVSGVPETYIVNPEGIIVEKFVGPVNLERMMSVLGDVSGS